MLAKKRHVGPNGEDWGTALAVLGEGSPIAALLSMGIVRVQITSTSGMVETYERKGQS